MIYEFDGDKGSHLTNNFVRPSISLAIRDSHDQDMEYDGAASRLKSTGFKHHFRYRYSNYDIAARHFATNMAKMNIPFGAHWTAFWVYRRLEGSAGKTYVAFVNERDAILFKLFWLKNNVEA